MTYEELRADLCRAYPGWTFADVDGMSFEQIGSALRMGKPREIEVHSIDEVMEYRREWRRHAGII